METPILHSPLPEVHIEDIAVHDYVLTSMKRHEADKRLALQDTWQRITYTYSTVADYSHRLATGFQRNGLLPGNRVSILSPNCSEYVISLLAIWKAGAAAVLLSPAYTKDDLKQYTALTECEFYVVHSKCLPLFESMDDYRNEKVFVIGESDNYKSISSFWFENQPIDTFEKPAINTTESIALIPFSSGTTGPPKAVLLSHRNLSFVLQAVTKSWQVQGYLEPGYYLIPQPLCHLFGVVSVLVGLTTGTTLVPMISFTLEEYVHLMIAYKLEASFWTVAAPLLPIDIVAAQGYGMTENACLTHFTPHGQPSRPGSVGVLVPGVSAKVIDPSTLKPLGPNERGELYIQSPGVCSGYLKNPTASDGLKTKDGWLKTGDVVYYDDDGYFYIVDRLKELIKCQGFQVAPAELEALLLTYSAVADAAVVGRADETSGELPTAFVVLKDEKLATEATATDIMNFVAAKVSYYKRLRGGVHFVSSIPKSPSGKILRKELRQTLKERL